MQKKINEIIKSINLMEQQVRFQNDKLLRNKIVNLWVLFAQLEKMLLDQGVINDRKITSETINSKTNGRIPKSIRTRKID